MSDTPQSFTESNRGFKQGEPILGDYGGSVRVYESSGASMAAIWMHTEESHDPNGSPYPVPMETTLLLNLDKARQLRDQLDYLINNHYQLDYKD